MLANYSVFPFLLRSPLLPLQRLLDIYNNYSVKALLELYHDPVLLDALYVASPAMYTELIRTRKEGKEPDKKAQLSLLKYAARAASRCTPYGMFAAVHSGTFSTGPSRLLIEPDIVPRLRLDMDYLCSLYQDLCDDTELMRELIYFPNSSLYRVAKKWRYVEYRFQAGRRVHHLVNIDDNPILSRLISQGKKGIHYTDIIALITAKGYSNEEAAEYTSDLIKSQVFVSELYPSVSGDEYQEILFSKLGRFNRYASLLPDLKKILAAQVPPGSLSVMYKTLSMRNRLLQSFPTSIRENRFVQVDSMKKTVEAQLDESLLNDIREAAILLNKLTPFDNSQSYLEKFKREFQERYEEAEVPLLEALDTDLGINYKAALNEVDYRSSNKNNMTWDSSTRFRMDLYVKIMQEGLKEIDLREMDLNAIPEPRHPISPSMALTGKIIRENGTDKFVWTTLTGPSPLYFMGRFGHLDPDIAKTCAHISAQEEENYPDRILAEIVHISEGRLGNILSRPALRKYEIPYLAQSVLDADKQIPLQDLVISLRNNHLYLRSRSLNKYILPRMANAHNYTDFGMPVYHFLCDLQFQQLKGSLKWSWQYLSNEPYLPRLTYKNVILSAACWNLRTERLKPLLKLKAPALYEQFALLKKELSLPDYVLYSQGDNELLLDLRVEACIDTLLTYTSYAEILQLEEFLFKPGDLLLKDTQEQTYTNEIIIPFVRKPAQINLQAQQQKIITASHKTRRSFQPYSPWIFYKFFCGNATADKMLTESLRPLCKKLEQLKICNKWFFIRYADPWNHLRVRFHVANKEKVSELHQLVEQYMHPYSEAHLVWKVQVDTYQRELERYGPDSIELAEDFFHINSKTVLELGKLFYSDEQESMRSLGGLLGVHQLYNAFDYSLEERTALTERSKNSFALEFSVNRNKGLRERIISEYRELNPFLALLIEKKGAADSLPPLFSKAESVYSKQAKLLKPISAELRSRKYSKNIHELVPSFIHMFVNRYFNSNQRFNEMMIYQFLSKYYASMIARKKYMK